MTRAETIAAIARDRAGGFLDEAGCRQALVAAGFDDGRAAAGALDQILAAAPVDLPPSELLVGCAGSADPGRALYNAGRLLAAEDRPPCPVSARDLATFLGASQHMADLLVLRPELLASLGQPFDPSTAAARYVEAGAGPDAETALRRAQQQDLIAIAWADLIEGLDVEQTTILISRLADAIIEGAARGLEAERHFGVVALGKLGGLELNYSSDIDLIFVRPDSVTDQASADRTARRLIQLLGRQTLDGHLYRVDMRLRPEGQTGALTRTVSSCLQYYETRGRPWERQMLSKARCVLESDGAVDAFLQGTRQWVLSRGLDAGAVRQFKRLKTATEARSDPSDVKHAPGGIRDIETIVQFLALVHSAHNPWLVCNSTLHGLERLRVGGAMSSLEVSRLRSAYLFHRRIENLLQVMHRLQTHRLPVDRGPLTRLMRIRDTKTLDAELAEHRARVRSIFERHFAQAFPTTEGPAAEVSHLALDPHPDLERFAACLADLGFSRPESSVKALTRAAAPVSRFLPPSPRLRGTFAHVAPAILEQLALSADPDSALDRFERMTRGVGAREVLYEQLLHEPELLSLLCRLADASPYLADLLAAEPQLFDACVDALLTGVRGRRRRREHLALVHEGRGLDPWLVLSDYKKLETLRIGALDLQESIDTRTVLAELSHLCIDILRTAYDIVLKETIAELGEPFTIKGMSARVPANMVVVALGKVGGLEANYGSDADVLFVYDGDGETDRGVANKVFFGKVASELIARVSGARGNPRLYKVDARLRPEGAKGPLVTNMRALETYYRSPRAALFEHQALLKARIVAGDAELGQRLLAKIKRILRQLRIPDDLPARMRDMRGKIESLAHGRDLKRGTGGMVDIEQLTQYLQLVNAARHPSVLHQETPRSLGLLADHGQLRSEDAQRLRATYLFFRRVETRLQIALGFDTKEIPDDERALRSLALHMGYADTVDGSAGHLFLTDLEEATTLTRKRYDQIVA